MRSGSCCRCHLIFERLIHVHVVDKKHNPTLFKVIINNHSIFPDDIGVLHGSKLSWKPHVHKMKTQLLRACVVLSTLKHYTTQSVLNVVYNSLIHP